MVHKENFHTPATGGLGKKIGGASGLLPPRKEKEMAAPPNTAVLPSGQSPQCATEPDKNGKRGAGKIPGHGDSRKKRVGPTRVSECYSKLEKTEKK